MSSSSCSASSSEQVHLCLCFLSSSQAKIFSVFLAQAIYSNANAWIREVYHEQVWGNRWYPSEHININGSRWWGWIWIKTMSSPVISSLTPSSSFSSLPIKGSISPGLLGIPFCSPPLHPCNIIMRWTLGRKRASVWCLYVEREV